MNRAVYDIPRWTIYQHRRERGRPLVQENDSATACFADELFSRLYSGEPPLLDMPVDFQGFDATRLHQLCTEKFVPEMLAKCKHDASMTAIGTQWLLDLLTGEGEIDSNEAGDGGPPKEVEAPMEEFDTQQGQEKDATHGLEQVQIDSIADDKRYDADNDERRKATANLIEDDERLKKIALLADKFKRMVITKQKRKFKHISDDSVDIEQGDEISRILPSEMVKFLSPRLRLSLMRDINERKAPQYSVQAIDRPKRGPLIYCIAKNETMLGDKDIWSTAVALALLDTAQRQNRMFVMLGYDHDVFHVMWVMPGKRMPVDDLRIPRGRGISILNVLDHAILAAERKTHMTRTDIVFVTDTASNAVRAPDFIRERAEKHDISITGIAMNLDAEKLVPWCDDGAALAITDMTSIPDKVATALFGMR